MYIFNMWGKYYLTRAKSINMLLNILCLATSGKRKGASLNPAYHSTCKKKNTHKLIRVCRVYMI